MRARRCARPFAPRSPAPAARADEQGGRVAPEAVVVEHRRPRSSQDAPWKPVRGPAGRPEGFSATHVAFITRCASTGLLGASRRCSGQAGSALRARRPMGALPAPGHGRLRPSRLHLQDGIAAPLVPPQRPPQPSRTAMGTPVAFAGRCASRGLRGAPGAWRRAGWDGPLPPPPRRGRTTPIANAHAPVDHGDGGGSPPRGRLNSLCHDTHANGTIVPDRAAGAGFPPCQCGTMAKTQLSH
jgi:hypothetical protein